MAVTVVSFSVNKESLFWALQAGGQAVPLYIRNYARKIRFYYLGSTVGTAIGKFIGEFIVKVFNKRYRSNPK